MLQLLFSANMFQPGKPIRAATLILLLRAVSLVCAQDPTAPPTENALALLAKQEKLWEETISEVGAKIAIDPQPALYSRRGDACFFLGRFKEAVADYEKMVELDESLKTSHWRLGIAYSFTRQFEKSEERFQAYHQFDQVDRENGLWRYLAQANQRGVAAAQKDLINYGKADRDPLPAIYRMFRAEQTPDELLKAIQVAELNQQEREKQLFYVELYIGLFYEVRKDLAKAKSHLEEAARSGWYPKAGYGPSFMGQVARLRARQIGEEMLPARKVMP